MVFKSSSKKSSGDKKKLPMIWFLIVLVPFVLWIVWFGVGSLMLNKSSVKAGLEQLSTKLENIGWKYDKEINFAHGDIEMKGWGYNKRAVIHDVSIDMRTINLKNPLIWKLSVDEVDISLDPVNSGTLVVEVDKPLTVLQTNIPVGYLKLSEPLSYYYTNILDNNVIFSSHKLVFPKQISFFAPKVNTVENDGKKNLEIDVGDKQFDLTFDEAPVIEFVPTKDGKGTNSTNKFTGLRFVKNGNTSISIGGWESISNEVLNVENNIIIGNYKLNMSDLELHIGETASSPYAFEVETNTAEENITPNKVVKTPTKDDSSDSNIHEEVDRRAMDIEIKKFVFSNPEFSVDVKGKLANTKGDSMPSGDIKIDIKNLQEFLASEIIAIQNKELIENFLVQAIGQPIYDKKDISFTIKRKRGGLFYIGKTTLAEIMTSLMSGSMMSKSPPKRLPVLPRAPARPQNDDFGGAGLPKIE
ncbi:MAG: hypothetical protein R3D71_04760 [Rickettsiales bacterium]